MRENQWTEMLTPESLREYGALDLEIPTESFDPNNDWDLTWRIWLLQRTERAANHSGYMSIKKENINNKTFNLSVEQNVLQVAHGAEHQTKALIKCANDLYSTPCSWELSRKFYYPGFGENTEVLSEFKTGVVESGNFKMTISGYDITHNLHDNITSNWSLMESLMRCGDLLEDRSFVILDELDKIKKGYTIKFRCYTNIYFGSRMVSVKRYDKVGEGYLPWSYYIDEEGRLLLAINGLRAYILDAAARSDHKKVVESLTKHKGAKKKQDKIFEPALLYDSNEKRPNILLITTDQQALNTISAYGNGFVNTPNIDRLVKKGVSFMRNYSTNPVCSPARSSIFTGRTTCETGVISNGLSIREDIPNIGQWLGPIGYETVFAGKWHVPEPYPVYMHGFKVLPGGLGGQATVGDQAVSSACAGWLMNRKNEKPFFLAANFLQPHDICNWTSRHNNMLDIEYDIPEEQLPPLPDNFEYDTEPKILKIHHKMEDKWSEKVWRYYIWSYYRMVEEVDAEIGRVLDALDASGYADNTVIIFTSDHGEGCAHHQTILKDFLYDEAVCVPLIISGGSVTQKKVDFETLASGLDIMPTVCDFVGISVPEGCKGISLKPICEGKPAQERIFVVTEVNSDKGRMIRTRDWKLVAYRNDSVMQLFDMKNDPGETKNLAGIKEYKGVLEEHKKLLNEWEASLDRAPNALSQFKL